MKKYLSVLLLKFDSGMETFKKFAKISISLN